MSVLKENKRGAEISVNKNSISKEGVLAPDFPVCPFRNIISRFGDKWSLLILYVLYNRQEAIRFSDLERAIPDISSRMLSSCLRALEADDLVNRKLYPEVPPRVEYSLTELAQSLIPHLQGLTMWAIENFDHVIAHRAAYNRLH